MVKFTILTVTLLALAACGGAEIITGDRDQVSVKTRRGTNPGPLATEHCRKFGRTAALQSTAETGVWTDQVYVFRCAQP